MEAKWFFGVTGSKNGFEHYLGTEYTYEKLISIHPLELQAIALEALFFGKKLNTGTCTNTFPKFRNVSILSATNFRTILCLRLQVQRTQMQSRTKTVI